MIIYEVTLNIGLEKLIYLWQKYYLIITFCNHNNLEYLKALYYSLINR